MSSARPRRLSVLTRSAGMRAEAPVIVGHTGQLQVAVQLEGKTCHLIRFQASGLADVHAFEQDLRKTARPLVDQHISKPYSHITGKVGRLWPAKWRPDPVRRRCTRTEFRWEASGR